MSVETAADRVCDACRKCPGWRRYVRRLGSSARQLGAWALLTGAAILFLLVPKRRRK